LGTEAIVEWNTPGESPAMHEFVSLTGLRKRAEREPVLPLAQIIFHCGRCGSTLLGRMLEVEPANRVLLEPNALLRFLEVNRATFDRAETRRDLQTLVAAYGLAAAPEEKRVVLKLSSTSIVRVELFRACFPDAQFVYLFRDPAEVVASELRGLATFLEPERRNDLAAQFGGAERALHDYTDVQWCAWYVDRNLRCAWRHADEFARAIDYAEHRSAYLEVCDALATQKRSAADPEMAAVLGAHSKQPDAGYSAGEDARKVPPGLREVVEPITRAAYGRWRERLAAGRCDRA
jgi:hypothetical protein